VSEIEMSDEPWPVWAKGVIESMRVVPSIARAARECRVARSTIQKHVQRNESLALAINEARQEALDVLEETILARARQGQTLTKTVTRTFANGGVEVIETTEQHVSDNLAMFYLKRWRPEYRDSWKVEHSGPNGGPIRFDVEKVDGEIKQLLEQMGA
jgi:hypothetical protein